jgi:lysophospholipid acyltransferase (LPLAT)-like uncharacterized protein
VAGDRKIGERITEMVLTSTGPLIIKLLGLTLRVRRYGTAHIDEARAVAGNVIYASWHGQLLLLTYLHRDEDIQVLVSSHRDGEYIARIIHSLGFGTVRGSTTRGGTKAVLNLLELGAGRKDLAITPDGPRGPRHHCKSGVIYLAKKTGLPVIPIGASHKPSLVLSSWDRFMIPHPFAKCAVVYGKARVYDQSVSEEAIEEARLDLEDRLNALTREADYACGRKTG